MPSPRHILMNGLSIGSGGGYTVGRELLRHLALERQSTTITLALVTGHPLHELMRSELLPCNCRLHFAPAEASARGARLRYERLVLSPWAGANNVDVVVQLNGMLVPGMPAPSLCHFQDPWPYRPEAWTRPQDRVIAFLKRREHARALRGAARAGWTSAYLRDLICGRLQITPKRSDILYNGVPESWIARARDELPGLEGRPLEIVTVSSVTAYKRQSLVIRALPALVARPELKSLVYRIIGECSDAYRHELHALAHSLRLDSNVVIHGRLSDVEVARRMATARCFVLMSVCESFGIPAIEAMTYGTPVVVSDCCAMPEVCGSAADLAPVDSVEALTSAIGRILEDHEHAEVLRRRGAEQVGRFSWGATARRLAAALTSITKRD